MPIQAITPDYHGEVRDRLENFHGNQLVYVGWDRHLLFCSAVAFPLAPDTRFAQLRDEAMAGVFGLHPEWAQVDWGRVSWLLDGEPFEPMLDRPLNEQGIGHKSLLRMQTPDLKGFQSAGV
ncbi:MAG: phenol hydroxylase [Oceanospirillaceae bacterium]|nr:phenol hydroxylase [Oceanospirillaceae bacterium]